MQRYSSSAERVLTEEQQRILDETAYDKRKIFLGAAGTGKTYIAMEKVRRLVKDEKRVLLTCFNRRLGDKMRKDLAGEIESGLLTATNFHDLLMNILVERGAGLAVPEKQGARGCFFQVELPERAFSLIAELPEEEKYDALVIDEGQDFREEWFMILQGLLKGGEQGEFYIFADPGQTLFNADSDAYASFEGIPPLPDPQLTQYRGDQQLADRAAGRKGAGGHKPRRHSCWLFPLAEWATYSGLLRPPNLEGCCSEE